MAEPTAPLMLPPLYRALRLEGEAPLDMARARAAELGAGTLLHAERPGGLSLAVILEPETPLAEARCAFYAGMSALAEAVAAQCPPDRSVTVAWPDTLLYDAARLGGGTLIWPEAAEDAVPDWLVFGGELIRDRGDLLEPGRFPGSTSLAEEAIGPVPALIERFASHLMRNFDTWSALGFAAMMERYLRRLQPPERAHRIGRDGALAEGTAGDLMVRRALAPALAARAWFDPARGGPRL